MTIRGGFNTGCGLMLSVLAVVGGAFALWCIIVLLISVAKYA